MSIKLVMPSNHLILCHPLFLLPSIFPSIRGFSNESVLLIRRPKDWSFSFSISPSNEYSRLISFRMDWLDLLAVQGTLKSLFQHHNSKHNTCDIIYFSCYSDIWNLRSYSIVSILWYLAALCGFIAIFGCVVMTLGPYILLGRKVCAIGELTRSF